jgi:MoaA/NifB/PqqE/SkfB family radical SAM enzyme
MEKSKTYCVMPHIGLSIQNHGDICVCNQNNRSLKNANGEVIFIHKDRLQDSWASPTRKEIIDALDNGIEHEACGGCFGQEKSGVFSQRQGLNYVFKDVIPSDTQPKVLIIKPGNVCNLACRMCNPATSSSWYNDAYKLEVKYDGVTESFVKWTKNFEHIRNGFHSTNIEFWNNLTEWLPNLEFLDIYGGEPMLSTELFNSLGKIADQGLSKNTSLRLHTNVTIYNERYLEILSKFKSVDLSLSIDSHDPVQLNYIRYPAQAEQIFENVLKIQKYFQQHSNHVTIDIALCINALNIYDSGQIYNELKKYGWNVGFSIVYSPTEYDIRILPIEVKNQILEKNKNFEFDRHENWKNYILQEVSDAELLFKKFWQTTKDLDEFRNQSFEETFPEYYSHLKKYII